MQFSTLPSLAMGTTENETQSPTAQVLDAVTTETVAPFDKVFFTSELQIAEGTKAEVTEPNSGGVDPDDLAPQLESWIGKESALLENPRSAEVLPRAQATILPELPVLALEAASSDPAAQGQPDLEWFADEIHTENSAANVTKEQGALKFAAPTNQAHFLTSDAENSTRLTPEVPAATLSTQSLADGENQHLEQVPANQKQPPSELIRAAGNFEGQLKVAPNEQPPMLEPKAAQILVTSDKPVAQMPTTIETMEGVPLQRTSSVQVQTDTARAEAQNSAQQVVQVPIAKVETYEGKAEGARHMPENPAVTDLLSRSAKKVQPELSGKEYEAHPQQTSRAVGASGLGMIIETRMPEAGPDQQKAVVALVQPLDAPSQDDIQEEASLRVVEQISTSSIETKTAIGQRTPDLPRGIAAQIAEVLRQNLDRPLELTLSPEELGRLRMSFHSDGSSMQVTLSFERADTLDLMRRHIDQLAQDMQAFGITDVSFTFQQQTSGDETESSTDEGTPQGGGESQISSSSPAQDDAVPIVVRANGAMGVDIRL